MSLSKQLLILISALFLMISGLNFVLSVNNIRSYLEGESQIHAQDTATSLGLSLSPYMVEETDPVIETTMNAIFDMGYYKEIKLVNVENKALVTLTNKAEIEGVPQWFVETISMKTATAESEISSGWSISGVLYVTINSGYAYVKLYEQVKSSFYYSLLAFIVSVILLLIVLRFTLSSLRKIDNMALTIAAGRFETIDQLPWTTEVRNVTNSMNMMSRKIEGAVNNLNLKLDVIGKKLHQDELTELDKKNVFDTEMKKLFISEEDAFILMVKIDGLAGLTNELDDSAISLFIKDFAQILKDVPKLMPALDITIYRFFAAEFVLLVKKSKLEQTKQVVNQLSNSFTKIGEKYNKSDIAHIGVATFNPVTSTEENLLAANEAYEQARIIGANGYFIRTDEDRNPAKDIAEWKAVVFDTIDNHKYVVSYIGQIENFQANEILMEEAFIQVLDGNGKSLSIGTFVSIAEKYEKIVDLDKGVTSQVVNYIKTKEIQHAVAINLSTRTIKNSDFRTWLHNLIKQNNSISEQLVFCISAYAVTKDIVVYKEFIEFVHKLNAKVIIKRFETQSMSPEAVKDLKPDYIRLSREIGNEISTNDGKRTFVETMQEIGALLDISILAENIHSDSDFVCIKAIGISGASR